MGNRYLVLNDSIQKNNLDIGLIFIASDQFIKLDKLKEQRELGIEAYYLSAPGDNAFLNRRNIKSFIGDVFPDQEISGIASFGFSIPTELLVDRNMKVLNAENASKSYAFVDKWIKQK